MTLGIGPQMLGRIRAHGERDYPEECCGVLLGTPTASAGHVVDVLELPNARADERRRRFIIRPDDYLRAESAARARGLRLIGFYHSHPDHPARPSEFDREHAWPNLYYVVVAVAAGRAGEATSWVLSEDRAEFLQEELRLLPTED